MVSNRGDLFDTIDGMHLSVGAAVFSAVTLALVVIWGSRIGTGTRLWCSAVDAMIIVARNVEYSARAWILCGDRFVRLIPAQTGPAKSGRPGEGQLHVLDMRLSWTSRVRVLQRGLGTRPDARVIARGVAEGVDTIMYAELATFSSKRGHRSTDVTSLAYVLPLSLKVTPLELCSLVLGKSASRECENCWVELVTLDGSKRFGAREVVSTP